MGVLAQPARRAWVDGELESLNFELIILNSGS